MIVLVKYVSKPTQWSNKASKQIFQDLAQILQIIKIFRLFESQEASIVLTEGIFSLFESLFKELEKTPKAHNVKQQF